MTVKQLEGEVFAYNVKFAQRLHLWNDNITPRNNLACCKQTKNQVTISLSLFMLQLPIAVTHRLQYQKLAFIAFLENNVKNCVGDIVYDLDQQKANHKTSSVADSLSGCGGQKTWDISPLAFSIEPPSDCEGEEEHIKVFLSQ